MTTDGAAEFRARSGRAMTLGVGAVCGAALVLTAAEDPGLALRYAPLLTLVPTAVWALYARPAVVVSDGGVELRNVLRTVHLPWPAIRRIDTKYALTLETAWGTYAAWAAPAPSRVQVLGATRGDTRFLPESTYGGGGVRPGDLRGTSSGDAAAYVRRRWEALRDAGHLDDPRLEGERPRTTWHVAQNAALLALAALAVAVLLV